MFNLIVKIFVVVLFLFLSSIIIISIGEAIIYVLPNSNFTKWWRKTIVGKLPDDDTLF